MCIVKRIKEIRSAKEQARDFEVMLMSVQEMLGVELDAILFQESILRLSNEEIEKLIKRLEATPSDRNNLKYLIYSIHKHQGKVFFINCQDLVHNGRPRERPSLSQWCKRIDAAFVKDKQILLLYDDFGLPETHLAARAGYVVFDPQINRIIAYRWMMIS